jgi:uncharacterized protein (TIGR00255 family)
MRFSEYNRGGWLMVRSMTGFGKATGEIDGDTISVELSSVNHRYLDCSVRLPATWLALEPIVKETVRKGISRGKVNVMVSRKRGTGARQSTVFLDKDIAKQYIEASRDLVRMLGSMETLSLALLAQLDGVFYQEEPEEDSEKVQATLVSVLAQALERLDSMRVTEGKQLEEELFRRLNMMRASLALIEQRLPELNVIHEQRLRGRIAEIAADVPVSEDRMALEVALIADKGDVTEEVVRLKVHFDHVCELLASDEPSGRELNFLTQELLREVNTLGSKVRDGEVVKEVLRLKSEVERIREQVQNIE